MSKWASRLTGEKNDVSVNPLELVFPESSLMTADPSLKESIEMEVVLDSGAGAHVASRAHIPGYAVLPSILSKAGAAFVGADGSRIKNHGEAALQLITVDRHGHEHAVHSNFQIADVTRALWSVGVICDSGLRVVFTRETAAVLGPQGKELCHFNRANGLYIAKVKLRNPAYSKASEAQDAGFRRQGS